MLAGRSLPHALMMMIPEAYAGRTDVPEELRGFYDFHGCLMEPWDGPASISFSDGTLIGATLDRNGLRPGRWLETRDGWVVLASEAGVLDIPAANVLRKGRLQPGKLFLVDLEQGRIVPDDEVKREIAIRKPYAEWFDREVVRLGDLPPRMPHGLPTGRVAAGPAPDRVRLLARGHEEGDPGAGLARGTPRRPSARWGTTRRWPSSLIVTASSTPTSSSSSRRSRTADRPDPGGDRDERCRRASAPRRTCSRRHHEHARQLVLEERPILLDSELEQLRQVHSAIFKARTLDMTWPVAEGPRRDGRSARSSLP